MEEGPREPSPPQPPAERVERIEIVERGPRPGAPAPRPTAPMWVWVLPLVLVVIALVWYILARGDPASPVEIITLLDGATALIPASPAQ